MIKAGKNKNYNLFYNLYFCLPFKSLKGINIIKQVKTWPNNQFLIKMDLVNLLFMAHYIIHTDMTSDNSY